MFAFIKKLFNTATIDFAKLLNDGAIVVDVRSASEFQSGHVKASRNIPLNSLGSRIDELKKLRKPVITVCRSGSRSASAKLLLEKAGIEVYNGGAWSNLKHEI